MYTKNDLELCRAIKQVIEYSQGFEPSVDAINEILKRWKAAKDDFIKLFGNEYSYRVPQPVQLSMPKEEQEKSFDAFLKKVKSIYNSDLAEYLEVQKDGFFDNIVIKDYEYNGKKIKAGTKLIKTFKYFSNGPVAVSRLQNRASELIQKNKMTGYLTFSVHPLDFLSASDNNHNWDSCHKLNGDHRSGNLSYLLDSSTIICYISPEKPETIEDFPFDWYSKKWRMWLFFSADRNMMITGRQYPFEIYNGIELIRKHLLNMPGSNCQTSWSKWYKVSNQYRVNESDSIYLDDDYFPVDGGLIAARHLIKDCSVLHYNDILLSNRYIPAYSYRIVSDAEFSHTTGLTSGITRFFIGNEVPCLRCGKHKHNIGDGASMLCNVCELRYGSRNDDVFGYCDHCGEHMLMDYGHWVADDEIVCSSCYNEYYRVCSHCNNIELKIDMIELEDSGDFLCPDCAEECLTYCENDDTIYMKGRDL